MGSQQQFILGFDMKWTLCLLCVASVATALPAKRQQKGFSLFSVVTFPNEICTTTMTPAMSGICVTAEECTNSGDTVATASGNCASGFGVCCFRSMETDGGAITQDVVHIQSVGFPAAVADLNTGTVAAVARAYNIMGGANICQIRLDFITVDVQAPTAGACAGDTISVATPDKTALQNGILALCGTLSGQHLYVDVSTATVSPMAATLNINTAGAAAPRMWKILARQIECNGDLRAPSGCRQYHTETSGRISSFNGANAVATAGSHYMIRNLNYNICIRKAAGMTGVTLREAGAGPDSFGLGATAIATGKSAESAGCGEDFIAFAGNRRCGAVLSSATGQAVTGPVAGTTFTIGVVADNSDSGAASGFDLIYTQT